MPHFLNLSDAGGDAVAAMLADAIDRKAARAGWPKARPDADKPLADHVLAMVFEKNSTRTRASFDIAIRQLGGVPMILDAGTTQLGRGETIADTARVLSRYADAIMIRTDDHAKVEELAEYAMTLLGTIIYVPPKDDEPGKFVPIVGEASSTLVTSLLDGTSNGNVLIFDCDEPDKCLDPGFKSLSLPASKALRPRVAALIAGMIQAIHDDTAITDAQKELLQVASIPLYKILTVQAAYGRGMPTDDRETLAEIASVDLLFAVLDRIVSEAGRSMSSFIGADEAELFGGAPHVLANPISEEMKYMRPSLIPGLAAAARRNADRGAAGVVGAACELTRLGDPTQPGFHGHTEHYLDDCPAAVEMKFNDVLAGVGMGGRKEEDDRLVE